MAWTLAAPLVRQPHDQGLDRVLDMLLQDPLPGADQRVPGPGPHIRQADRVDPVCHPARAPHVLPLHPGRAGLSCPVTQNWLICTPSPSAPPTLPGVQTRRSARNYLGRAARFGYARLLGSGHQPPEVVLPDRSAGLSQGASASPTETPQVRDTMGGPHRNPTDETAHSGTLVIRVKGTENSRSAAWMRVSWAVGAFSR
jgi:hypothetical protein